MLQQIEVRPRRPVLREVPHGGGARRAPIAEAIQAWGDLGRYRRVVSLHRTARIIVEVDMRVLQPSANPCNA